MTERTVRRVMLCIAVVVLSLPVPLAADLNGHFCEQWYDCEQLVDRIRDVFRSGDRSKIVRTFHYPLRRTYPLPYIEGPQKMLEHYEDVFDETITTWISDSELTDWSDMGWRGIMLDHGVVWLRYDGLLLALNYSSEREQAERERLLRMERASLHRSLQEDHDPIFEWITEHYRVRVDSMRGVESVVESGYRYAVWDADKTHDQEPDLILYGGQLIFEGSGGNHRYLFTNGDYRYEVCVSALGKDTTPIGLLKVFRVDDLGTDSLYVEKEEVKGFTLLHEPVVARYRPASNTDTTRYTNFGDFD